MKPNLRQIFEPQGVLAVVLPKFEHRPGQGMMAALVEEALGDSQVALIEAPTGTGKTIAYLLPAVLAGRRIVISTGTKALQEQIVNKDIPLAEKVLGRSIKAEVVKGRRNYLCRARFHLFRQQPTFEFKEEIELLDDLLQWAETTETGDRAELTTLADDAAVWNDLCSSSESCLGARCGFFSNCFITRLRARAAKADLLVVNHHLLFADLSLKTESQGEARVLPDFDSVICDEAHQIEATATSYFGKTASLFRFHQWERDLERFLGSVKLVDQPLLRHIKDLLALADPIFDHYRRIAGDELRLSAPEASGEVEQRLLALTEQAKKVSAHLEVLQEKHERPELHAFARRLMELAGVTDEICAADETAFVYWREPRPRGVILHKDPIELADAMRDTLFAQTRATVFTSATLTAAGEFKYIKNRLGIGFETLESSLPTCFDYPRQGVLFLPKDLPDPRDPQFLGAVIERIEALVRAAGGRSLCLFTSIRNMQGAYEALAPRLPFPCHLQGQAPKHHLLDIKRRQPESVLFATASFWEGVDIAGDALQCVIVDKLPFASPSDPLIAARIEKIKNDEGNPFRDFQLPAAIIALKQGLGRLIRSTGDRGVLALLDHRIHTKSYGRRIIESLPPFLKTSKLEDVLRYLNSLAEGRAREADERIRVD